MKINFFSDKSILLKTDNYCNYLYIFKFSKIKRNLILKKYLLKKQNQKKKIYILKILKMHKTYITTFTLQYIFSSFYNFY